MKKSDKYISLAVAIAIHALLLLVLLFTFLRYPPAPAPQWPPERENEIIMESLEPLYSSGEFVRTGDTTDELLPTDTPAPSNETNVEPTQDAVDPTNAGVAADPKEIVSSQRPSPAKTEKKVKGPTKEEIAAEKARQEAKKQQQTRKNVADATAKAFGKGDKGKQTPGAAEGNSAEGATTGTPGNGLWGRTLESWTTTKSTKLGVIAVRVRVDSQGRVIEATYDAAGSSGAVAADAAMRSNCVARTRQCRFSVLENQPVQSGTVTWVFK